MIVRRWDLVLLSGRTGEFSAVLLSGYRVSYLAAQ